MQHSGADSARCFDFAVIPRDTIDATVRLIQLGESLGYRCAWIADQEFLRDPFVLLAAAALGTKTIHLGLGVTSPLTRLPVQIARAAASVDELGNGRFRLGLGTANAARVLRPLGIEPDRPVGRLRDAIVIIRQLFAGESVNFVGRHERLTGVGLGFPSRSTIPIYLGTRGPKTLELAGELADGILANALFSGGGIEYMLSNLRSGAERRSELLARVDVVSWQVVEVCEDLHRGIDRHRAWLASAIRAAAPEVMSILGLDNRVVEGVKAANDNRVAEALVTDEAAKCLMIVGPPDDVRNQVADIFDHGVNSLCLLLNGDAREAEETLVRFASDVMPTFI
jgi:5,10-methylenetetrahydromethanopterin reductase